MGWRVSYLYDMRLKGAVIFIRPKRRNGRNKKGELEKRQQDASKTKVQDAIMHYEL